MPLRAWAGLDGRESLLIAETLALAVMLIEAAAWRGLDNLFVPVGATLMLRALLPLDAETLQVRLYSTIVATALLTLAGCHPAVSERRGGRVSLRIAIAAWLTAVATDLE